MKKYCECGKELDERIKYCVHCCKGIEKEEEKVEVPKKKGNVKSVKYSPLLDIFKGNI